MADQIRYPRPAAFPLVGREREQALLRAALAAALDGRGSLVLIGGEAGIGKTALAEAALAEAASQGALALVGRCYDLSETPPYGPWAEALARAPMGDARPVLQRRCSRPITRAHCWLARRRSSGAWATTWPRPPCASRSCSSWRTCIGPILSRSTCCASCPATSRRCRSSCSPPTAPTKCPATTR